MTASNIDRTAQQQAWLACHKQRVEARRARFNAAQACCPDCAKALRTDPLDRARYHVARAKAHADDAARAAQRARRANIIATAILVPLSLVVLFFAVVALING